MKLFHSSPPPLVGLDIGSSSVKLLQLGQSGTEYRVEHMAVEPLPEGAIVENNIVEHEQVANTIRRALKRSGSRAKLCAVAVSGSAVITKVINLPAELDEQEIESQIEIEAGQYVPYPRDEVSLDFEILGPSARNADLLEILLAASKTENVEARREVAEMAGLTTKVVDVEAFSLCNAFELVRRRDGINDSDTIGVLDMGSTMSTLVILSGDRVTYNREHPFGGRQLVEECMRRYGMEMHEANFLERGEEPPAGFEDEVLEPFRQNVVLQISRALQFYSSSSTYTSISTLYLSGGSASIPGLCEAVGNELGISCELADPLKGLRLAPRISAREMERHRSALTSACGLALRGFD